MSARKLLRLSHQLLVGCEGVESCGQLSSGSWQQSAGYTVSQWNKTILFCELWRFDTLKYHVPLWLWTTWIDTLKLSSKLVILIPFVECMIASNIIAWIWSFQLNMDMIKRRWRRLFEEVQLKWDCEMVILRIDRNKLPQTTDRDAGYCIIIVDWFETEMEIMTVRSDVKMIIQR